MKPLIVGQAPARGNDGKQPFAGQSGAKLARLAGVGESGDILPIYFELVNLMDSYPGKQGKGDAFDMATATRNARLLQDQIRDQPSRKILLMGRKVRRAMGLKGHWEYLEWVRMGNHLAMVFPHPSGINRWWNDPDNEEAARLVMEGLVDGKAFKVVKRRTA